MLTYVGVGAQIGAGVLLVLGLFTPLAAAAALAYLINALLAAVVAQPEPGYFAFFLPDGHEYQVTLIVVAAAIILTGPGRYGFDAGRGWARRPFIGSFVALVLGIGGGVARLGVAQRRQPARLDALARRDWAPGRRWPRSAAAASRTSPRAAAARDRP